MKGAGIEVVLDARIPSGEWGGVEGVVVGLARGLSGLTDSPDRYRFLTYRGHDAWLEPYLAGPTSALPIERPAATAQAWRRGLARRLPGVARTWRNRPAIFAAPGLPPPTDGTVERAGADVVHFTFQAGFRTAIPSIYHPHDLQHLHLPQFFPPVERRRRELLYRTMCDQAAMVAVASRWTKGDVEKQYGLPPEKVVVVPLAPPIDAYPEIGLEEARTVVGELGLPTRYILYPALTWPHKNHAGLLDALGALRLEGIRVAFVSTGMQTDHLPSLVQRAEALRVSDQVHWLGFLPPRGLRAVYRCATAVVIPTLFEAASSPLWEAFLAGVPAACSAVTSLPEQAGDAAILFDPLRTDEIADAIRRLWLDGELRSTLVARGRERVAAFSWDRTARLFRAHYRRLAGRPLDEADALMIGASTSI